MNQFEFLNLKTYPARVTTAIQTNWAKRNARYTSPIGETALSANTKS